MLGCSPRVHMVDVCAPTSTLVAQCQRRDDTKQGSLTRHILRTIEDVTQHVEPRDVDCAAI